MQCFNILNGTGVNLLYLMGQRIYTSSEMINKPCPFSLHEILQLNQVFRSCDSSKHAHALVPCNCSYRILLWPIKHHILRVQTPWIQINVTYVHESPICDTAMITHLHSNPHPLWGGAETHRCERHDVGYCDACPPGW